MTVVCHVFCSCERRCILPLKVPNVGLEEMLPLLTGDLAGAEVCLFVNNYTPVAGSVVGNFTEATFPGYAREPLAGWDAVAIVSDHARQNADDCEFTLSATGGPYSVYGYFVLTAGGDLLWAERDPNAPGVLSTTGDVYRVIPQLSMASEF